MQPPRMEKNGGGPIPPPARIECLRVDQPEMLRGRLMRSTRLRRIGMIVAIRRRCGRAGVPKT